MFNQLVALIEQADDDGSPTTTTTTASGSQPPRSRREAPELSDSPRQEETVRVIVDGGDAAAQSSKPARGFGNETGEQNEAQHDAEEDGDAPVETLDCGEATADRIVIARLSRRVAELEIGQRQLRREAAVANDALQAVKERLAAKEAALRRAVQHVREGGAADEDALFEAEAALDSTSEGAVEELNAVVRHQAQALADAEQQLRSARSQVVALEAAGGELERAHEALRAQAKELEEHAVQDHHALASSKKETARLSAKLTMLRVTVDDMTAKHAALQRDLDAATAQLVRRDNELAALRHGGSQPTRELRQDPVVAAVARNKWGNRAVGAAAMLDVVVLRFGRLLRANASLRLLAVAYVLVLHAYVFNAIMVFLHHSSHMPDHMGDDVHDHIANHLHHR